MNVDVDVVTDTLRELGFSENELTPEKIQQLLEDSTLHDNDGDITREILGDLSNDVIKNDEAEKAAREGLGSSSDEAKSKSEDSTTEEGPEPPCYVEGYEVRPDAHLDKLPTYHSQAPLYSNLLREYNTRYAFSSGETPAYPPYERAMPHEHRFAPAAAVPPTPFYAMHEKTCPRCSGCRECPPPRRLRSVPQPPEKGQPLARRGHPPSINVRNQRKEAPHESSTNHVLPDAHGAAVGCGASHQLLQTVLEGDPIPR